jgi:hypothetical protein
MQDGSLPTCFLSGQRPSSLGPPLCLESIGLVLGTVYARILLFWLPVSHLVVVSFSISRERLRSDELVRVHRLSIFPNLPLACEQRHVWRSCDCPFDTPEPKPRRRLLSHRQTTNISALDIHPETAPSTPIMMHVGLHSYPNRRESTKTSGPAQHDSTR